MEAKKHPKYDLQSRRGLFFQVGLLLALLFVNAAFEWRVEEHISTKVRLADIEKISEDLERLEQEAQLQRPVPQPQDAHREEEILIKVKFLLEDEE